VVVAEACTGPPLPELRVALLGYAAQLDDEVPLATCTVTETPDDRSPKLQLSVWFEIEQAPGPL
jgi:hypothetical protein